MKRLVDVIRMCKTGEKPEYEELFEAFLVLAGLEFYERDMYYTLRDMLAQHGHKLDAKIQFNHYKLLTITMSNTIEYAKSLSIYGKFMKDYYN